MNWLTEQQWVPVCAPKTAGSLGRHPGVLIQIATQFNVETHPRYRPGPGVTWCATYVWDVTRALACELPHWWFGKELRANDIIDWLGGEHGQRQGWELCTQSEAREAAKAGLPCVATWRNSVDSRPGHVAMVLPPPLAALGTPGEAGTWIAQAGAKNVAHGPLEAGFGALPVRYWRHD